MRGHNRTCASGTVTWVDAHISKNPKKMQAGYLPENLLYLYWSLNKKYSTLPDIPGYRGRNEFDAVVQFWIEYWKEQKLIFPEDLDPLMVKAMIAVESGFNQNAKNKKGSAGGLLQILDSAIRTLWGVPNRNGWADVTKERIHILYGDKFDPVINIAVATRLLAYKYSKIKPPFSKNAEGMIAGYNQFNPKGQKYAEKVIALYKQARNGVP